MPPSTSERTAGSASWKTISLRSGLRASRGQGDQTEDGQGRPEERAQPAAQVGMPEPGEEEGEERRGEGAAPRTHGDVGGAHREAS